MPLAGVLALALGALGGSDVATRELFDAALRGDGEQVALLLPRVADVNAVVRWGRTPLHAAAEAGYVAVVQRLLEACGDVRATANFRRTYPDSTPLHLALERQHLDVARLLVLYGADVNAGGRWGWTPLHGALSPQDIVAAVQPEERWRPRVLELVAWLLEEGADASIPCSWPPGAQMHVTPLHLALERGRRDVADAMIAAGTEVDPLAAVLMGDAPRLARLVRERPDVLDGPRLLCAAVRRGEDELVRALLALGGDIDAVSQLDGSALHVAVSARQERLLRVLLDAGADVDVRSADGATPLAQAARASPPATVQILLDAGADVNARDVGGRTPLHAAAAAWRADVVPLLLDAGADVNARDVGGRTPLHAAAAAWRADVVPLLLDAGADVNARDTLRHTPQWFASLGWNLQDDLRLRKERTLACLRAAGATR